MPNNFLSEFQNFFREIDHIRILEEFRKNSEGKAANLPQFCQSPSLVPFLLNTSDLTDSYIIFTLKMEFVSKNTIFGLKLMVKSGLEFFFVKFLHALSIIWIYLIERRSFGQKYKFSNGERMEEFQKYFFYTTFHPSFLGQNL